MDRGSSQGRWVRQAVEVKPEYMGVGKALGRKSDVTRG